MRRKTQVVSIFLLSFIVISISNTAAIAQEEREWKVKVGDSKTYELTKYFDDSDSDGDGDEDQLTITVTDEDGDSVNVTLKEYSTIKVEITKLNDEATVQTTYNGNVTTEEMRSYSSVRKTVDDKTYWEKYSEKLVGDFYSFEISVDDKLLVNESIIENVIMGITYETTVKRDWKTGWITYYHYKIFNDTDTMSELEHAVKTAGGITGFETVPILLEIFVMTVVVTRKRK